jgi:hypothetical protein
MLIRQTPVAEPRIHYIQDPPYGKTLPPDSWHPRHPETGTLQLLIAQLPIPLLASPLPIVDVPQA